MFSCVASQRGAAIMGTRRAWKRRRGGGKKSIQEESKNLFKVKRNIAAAASSVLETQSFEFMGCNTFTLFTLFLYFIGGNQKRNIYIHL